MFNYTFNGPIHYQSVKMDYLLFYQYSFLHNNSIVFKHHKDCFFTIFMVKM